MGLYLAHHEEKGSTVTMLGTIMSSEVNNLGIRFFESQRFTGMGYSIWNLSEADFPDFEPGENPDIHSAAVEAARNNPSHKIGFVVSNPAIKGLCESLIGLDVTTALPWNLKVFPSMEQAHDWVMLAS